MTHQPRSGAVGDLKSSNGGYAWEDEYQRPWDIVKDMMRMAVRLRPLFKL